MKQWIRWKGLIPFICIIGVLLVFWYLLLDILVERVIESTGTRIVGAKVEIDHVDVTLFPAGVAIARMQVTNPEAPLSNSVEIASMVLAVNTRALLLRKVIVEEMTMDGVRFNTARKTSGEIQKSREKKTADLSEKAKKMMAKAGCAAVELPTLQMPDIQKLLAAENLESIEIIRNYRTLLDSEKRKFQESLATLPDENKLDGYRQRVEKLQAKKSSINVMLTTAKDVVQLKKDIQTDVDRLKDEVEAFKSTSRELQTQFSQLSNAPAADIRRLKNKYTISPQGMANMSQLLLGTRFCEWWEKGYLWYQRIKPYLKLPDAQEKTPATAEPVRRKGINVKFPEKNPLPDFLIRLARANVVLESGELNGVLENVTTDQPIVGKPLTFTFSGTQMKRIASVSVEGTMDHVVPAHPAYHVNADIQALEFKDFALSAAEALPVTLGSALADIDIRFSLVDANLTAKLNSEFNSTRMSVDTKAVSGRLAEALASAVSGIDAFDFSVGVRGTTEAYAFEIRSDLDDRLNDAVGDLVRKETAEFTARLEREIKERIDKPLAEAGSQLKTLGPIGDELTRRLDLGQNLLKADVFKGVKLPM